MKSRLKRLLRKARQPVTERRVLDTALELLGEEPEEYLVASELFRRKACALRAEGRFEQASLAIRRALRSCWVDVQLCQLEQALNARKMGDLDLAFRAAQEFVWHGGDPAILPEELEKHAEWIRARHPDLGVDRGSNLFVEDDVELSEVDETGLVWRSVGVLWTVASRRDVLTTMHLVGEGNDPNSSFRIGDRTETVLGCIVATDRVEAVQELLSLGAKPAAGVASPMLCARRPRWSSFSKIKESTLRPLVKMVTAF